MLLDPEKGEVIGSDYLPAIDTNFKGKPLVDPTTEELLYEIPFDRFHYVKWDFDPYGDNAKNTGNAFCLLSKVIHSEDKSTSWAGIVDFTIDRYEADDGYMLHIYKHYPDSFKSEFEAASGEEVPDYDIWLVHDEEIMDIVANESDEEASVRFTRLYEVAPDTTYVEDFTPLRSEMNNEFDYIIINENDDYDVSFNEFKNAWGEISNMEIIEEEDKHYVNKYDYDPRNIMDKYTLISRCLCSSHFNVTRPSTSQDEFTGGNRPINVIDFYQYTTVDTYAGKKYTTLFDEEIGWQEVEVGLNDYQNWAMLPLNDGFYSSTIQPNNGYSSRVLQFTPYSLNAVDKLNEKVDHIVEGIEETFIHFQEEIDSIMSDVTNTISNLYVSR